MVTPSRELTRAVRNYRTAEASLGHARSALHATILEQLHAGVTQSELVRATGYSREQLRRLARAAGMPVHRSAVFSTQP